MASKKELKWQVAEKTRVSALSNYSLLEETLSAAQGDDYDGCFTSRGQWTFDNLKEELESRLRKVSFLPLSRTKAVDDYMRAYNNLLVLQTQPNSQKQTQKKEEELEMLWDRLEAAERDAVRAETGGFPRVLYAPEPVQ